MKKTVILVRNKSFYYFPYLNKENIDVISLCGKKERFWLRLCKYFPKLIEKKLYLQLKKKNYEQIIVFDAIINSFYNMTNVLLKLDVSKKLYIWNMIGENAKLISSFKLFDEIFSFSKSDSEKYNLIYLPLAADNISKKINNNIKDTYQFFFLGYAKNRINDILKVYNTISKFKNKFIVITDEKFNNDDIEFRNKKVEYDEYIKYLLNSNCLIDINNNGQDGYTLRMSEAFCYNKKIITTNTNVLKSEFYDESRILIYNEKTTYEDIYSFLNKPINSIESNYFDFDIWLDKITNS